MPNDLIRTGPDFHNTAIAYPSLVDSFISENTDPQNGAKAIAQTQLWADYAKQIKATTEEINAIEFGKLKLCAHVGKLCPAESASKRGAKGGRGNKAMGCQPIAFDPGTLVDYRKIATHQEAGRLDSYWQAIDEAAHEAEMSIAGFLRFVGSNGNIKAHQNKGVIEWYTPESYIEAARKTMGRIDLDPCSSEQANKVVKAKRFFTQEDDGLEQIWKGNVWMNPPFKADLICRFISMLCNEFKVGSVKQAILLTNNNTDTRWWHEAAETCHSVCFTKGRVPFYNPAGETAAPTNGHNFFYFGESGERFHECFSPFGTIMEVCHANI